MKMIQKLKEIIDKHDKKTFYQMVNYSQFTIDTFEYFEEKSNREGLHENKEQLGCVQDLIWSMIYEIENILEIIKEGKDKDIFKELLEDLKNTYNK